MIRRPPRSTQSRSSAASDVYKRQLPDLLLHDLRAVDADRERRDRHAALRDSEKLVHRAVQLLAFPVPQREVEGGHDLAVGPGLFLRALEPRQVLPGRETRDGRLHLRERRLRGLETLVPALVRGGLPIALSLIHISEPTRLGM